MRRKVNQWLVLWMTGILVAGLLPAHSIAAETSEAKIGEMAQVDYGLDNPRVDHGVTTWDCIYFGNYWQEDTDGDGNVDKNDDKTPIKWRVLSVEGDDAFLLADKNLDCQSYNSQCWQITWENCTMRSWLNGYGAVENKVGMDYSGNGFLDNAFTESERQTIKTTDVVNNDNPDYGTAGGNDTVDQIYLLSLDELTNPAYGFISSTGNTDTRQAVNTAYTAGGGEIGGSTQSEGRADYWWSRSPGKNSSAATLVHADGQISGIYLVNYVQMVVRPVLHLNLADSRESWSSAGTVAAGKSTATPMSTEKPTDKPTPTPTPTSVYTPTPTPVLVSTQEPTLTPTGTPVQTVAPTGKPTAVPTAATSAEPTPDATLTPENKEVNVPDDVSSGHTGGKGSSMAGGSDRKENDFPGNTIRTEKKGSTSKKTSIPNVAKIKKYKVRAKKRGVVLTWKKDSKISGYQIQVSTKKNFKSAKKILIKKGKKQYKISKLISGEKYYVRIRAYQFYQTPDGAKKRAYGKWTIKRIRIR